MARNERTRCVWLPSVASESGCHVMKLVCIICDSVFVTKNATHGDPLLTSHLTQTTMTVALTKVHGTMLWSSWNKHSDKLTSFRQIIKFKWQWLSRKWHETLLLWIERGTIRVVNIYIILSISFCVSKVTWYLGTDTVVEECVSTTHKE